MLRLLTSLFRKRTVIVYEEDILVKGADRGLFYNQQANVLNQYEANGMTTSGPVTFTFWCSCGSKCYWALTGKGFGCVHCDTICELPKGECVKCEMLNEIDHGGTPKRKRGK